MREESANPDLRLAEIAQTQHGIVTYEQILAAGISTSAITRRVQSGRLHRIHRRVYALGHGALGNEGRWLAAVLAVGENPALGFRSAAEHLRLLEPRAGPVHVITFGENGRKRRQGIRIHRSSSLRKSEILVRDGIRVTTPARTLMDLRRVVAPAEFRKAVRQAEVLNYQLGGVEVDGTRSELEYLFLRLCRRHRLPRPEVNVRVRPYVVDFLWREQRLIVETDGERFHRGALASANDGRRDDELRGLGYEVRRFSYLQVTRDRAAVAAEVRQALSGWRAIPAIRE
jgi:very-short-patch-repair endonuclease